MNVLAFLRDVARPNGQLHDVKDSVKTGWKPVFLFYRIQLPTAFRPMTSLVLYQKLWMSHPNGGNDHGATSPPAPEFIRRHLEDGKAYGSLPHSSPKPMVKVWQSEEGNIWLDPNRYLCLQILSILDQC